MECVFCGRESELDERLCDRCAPCREMMLKNGDPATRDGDRFYRIRLAPGGPVPSA